MIIMYPVTKHYTKEVYSKEHDEKLKLLESMKEIGLIVDIEKRYGSESWELIGYINKIIGTCYVYQGAWEEDIGEPKEVGSDDIYIDFDGGLL